jgi:hypothetical protein
MSPERTRYALQQFFTYGNIYTDLVGGGLSQMMGQLPHDVREKTTNDMLRRAPFARRIMKTTNPYTEHSKALEDARLQENTRRFMQNRELDALAEQYYSGRLPPARIKGYIAEQPKPDRDRLESRFERYGKTRKIPDRRWWLNLSDLSPEVRARVYWLRYESADSTEKGQLTRQLKQVPGVSTERFNEELKKLRRQQ